MHLMYTVYAQYIQYTRTCQGKFEIRSAEFGKAPPSPLAAGALHEVPAKAFPQRGKVASADPPRGG